MALEPKLTALASAIAGRPDQQADKGAFGTAVDKRGAELAATFAAIDGTELAALLSRQDIERSLTS